jgi:Core-2/I-Branching enzyme
MRLAYLIMAHKNPEQLARLVKTLIHRDAELFIHIDGRRRLAPFLGPLKALEHRSVHIIADRVPIYQAGFPPGTNYSQARAILVALAEVLSISRNFDYLILLSGQDYPIKTNDMILKHFDSNNGKEFLQRFSVPTDPYVASVELNTRMGHVQRYHVEDWLRGYYIKGLNRVVNLILPRKEFPRGYTPYWGSVYWRLTIDCAAYICNFVTRNPEFVRFFRFANCPDECIFHTIVLNSNFSKNVVDDNLTYMDWPGTFHPKTLTAAHFSALAGSAKTFARKFDMNTDSHILDLIETRLLGKEISSIDGEGSDASATTARFSRESGTPA